ncbi:DUF4230 domain-containing protein [Fibrivirga algicola]|uniref:DUF4230 domain-containing protein n=1 Tax=Fibrivirga algicola TaxID=2950420 RepID=A0ABX0QA82_9BACT|nr:DUF4230 domain-containing protein [Fibrivirga algicola]ARK09221.1 hypothetical protein A6C57_02150 [Fibrella sp. ES10-3-2-2]NID08667.1 DUF4230 domain-containing protein [Fibrivirga algicola]
MDFLNTLLLLTVGLAGGVGLTTLLRSKSAAPVTDVRHESTLLLERIEKVFKVVMAEGYFSEIYNYQDQKKILYMFNDPKKAMIIAKSKVLVGFDFQKVRFRLSDSGDKTLVVESFPEPEILSVDTDYKFYDIQSGILNHFDSETYTSILDEAKQAMQSRALQSDLPRIANNQIQYMMYQLAGSMGWALELPEGDQRKIEAIEQGKPLALDPPALPHHPTD